MAKSTTVVLCVFALLALICIGLAQAETSEAPKAKFDRSEKGKAKDRITNNKENLNILNAEGREALEAFAKQPKTIKSSSGFPYQLIGVNADAESLADVKDADKVIFSISGLLFFFSFLSPETQKQTNKHKQPRTSEERRSLPLRRPRFT